MELLSIPHIDEIQNLEEVGKIIESEILAKTYKNTLYKVQTDKGTFVVKHSRRGWGKYEYESMKRLRDEGYSVPEVFAFFETEPEEGESCYGTLEKTTGILVMEFIDGPSLYDNISNELIENAAIEISKIHQDPRHKKTQPFIKNYKEIEISRLHHHFRKTGADFENLKNGLDRLSIDYLNEKTEYTTIHGDFRPSNILIKKDKLYLIDFEGTCEGGDPFKDVGIFYGEVLVNNPEYAEIFRKSYGTEMNTSMKFHTIRRLLVLAAFENVDRTIVKKHIQDVLRSK